MGCSLFSALNPRARRLIIVTTATACRLVTNITSTLPAGAVLDVVLWVYKNQRTTQTGSSTSMLWASRDASTTCAKGACDDSIKRIRTVIISPPL